MRTLPLLASLLWLSSCGSPPKPPAVNESTRRPANSTMAVDLQACKGELQSARIQGTESQRIAESAAAALARVSARRQEATATLPPSPSAGTGNAIFSIRFGFGSTRIAVPPGDATALIAQSRVAPLVLLRGRTDGTTNSLADSRIARERASAVRDYLVHAGIDPAGIRATYQPAGDFAADNSTAAGRGVNRRVEIEVYRTPPVVMGSADAMP